MLFDVNIEINNLKAKIVQQATEIERLKDWVRTNGESPHAPKLVDIQDAELL